MSKLRICLIGSGGVGTIASYVLQNSGRADVTAVLRSKYTYVSSHGWDIESVDHGTIKGWRPHRVVSSAQEAASALENEEGEEYYDYVVVCTKQLPSVAPVPATIAPVVTPGKTTIVLIQNGMGIEEDVVARWRGNVVLSSVSHIGSAVKEPNVVQQMGTDVSKIGAHFHPGVSDDVSSQKAREFVEMYVAGGAHKCELAEDIQVARWEKLLFNGTFNTVCALARMDVGAVQRSKGRETMLIPMMWEIWNIARASGHGMDENLVNWMAYRLPDDCDYRPSMLLDLEAGRPMELEVILGIPLRIAGEIGVDAPVLRVVHNLLKMEEWKVAVDREKK